MMHELINKIHKNSHNNRLDIGDGDTMKKKTIVLPYCLFLYLTGANAETAPSLPSCTQEKSVIWDNCVGLRHYPNGDTYSGEFKNGKREGTGSYKFSNGDMYEGNFRGGKRNGKGTSILKSGEKYVGEYRDDLKDGKGELTLANGVKYIGEFSNNTFNGNGMIQSPNGEQYSGNFVSGTANGDGKYVFTNKRVYIGKFKENKRDGYGILYDDADHALISGNWKDGRFEPSSDSGSTKISLEKEHDTWILRVRFNDSNMKFNAVLDTGASYVSIPEEIFASLRRAGGIGEDDFTDSTDAVLANGEKIKNDIYNIRKLSVGGATVYNVQASVSSSGQIKPNTPILIGQAFLQKFKSYKIDNETKTLILDKQL